MSTRHRLLWIDLIASVEEAETVKKFEGLFEIHRCSALSTIDAEIERAVPIAICFNFDFPTRQGLQTLQRIKQSNSSTPVLMLTVQHSEALAVWAFRCKVWDYFVKPIPTADLERCLCNLAEMMALKDTQPKRSVIVRHVSNVPEESRANGVRGHAALALEPAIRYVERNFRHKTSSARAAELCHLTPFQFSRLFKETYGLAFQEYLQRYRIREACRLLKNPNAQVGEVGYLVGFNDPSYFGKVFRRYTNFSPSHFCSVSEVALDANELLEVLAGE